MLADHRSGPNRDLRPQHPGHDSPHTARPRCLRCGYVAMGSVLVAALGRIAIRFLAFMRTVSQPQQRPDRLRRGGWRRGAGHQPGCGALPDGGQSRLHPVG